MRTAGTASTGTEGMGANQLLLAGMIEVAVRMEMDNLRQQGGPDAALFDWARTMADRIAEKGDSLQYGGRKGEAAGLFADLAKALAIMSFCPGGVEFCGTRYESKPDGDR